MTDGADPTERVAARPPTDDSQTARDVPAPPLVPPGVAEAPAAAADRPAAMPDGLAPPLLPPSEPILAPISDAGMPPPMAAPPPGPPIPLVPTRRLLATSFDLLIKASNDMRRASFYAGGVTLGTVGPLVLAALILEQEGVLDETAAMTGADASAALVLLILSVIGFAGLMVAIIEGRNLGFLVLGGQMAGRPITTRQALARSRRIFWPSVGAAIVVGLVIGVAQAIVSALFEDVLEQSPEIGFALSTIVAAIVGAPFAYTLAGVVLGDVGPIEAIRRSFKVFRARRAAAVVIVLFESFAFLLVFLGLGAGLDLVIRVFQTLGLSPDAGPLGFALTVVGVVALVFAVGTLLFTVYALTVAPQVVMFLGLTHATYGLDVVRSGGRDDPAARGRRGSSGWFTTGMILAFISAAVGLALIVAYALA